MKGLRLSPVTLGSLLHDAEGLNGVRRGPDSHLHMKLLGLLPVARIFEVPGGQSMSGQRSEVLIWALGSVQGCLKIGDTIVFRLGQDPAKC